MQTVTKQPCPKCHADTDQIQKHGFKTLYQKRVQKFQCQRCGHVFHN